MQMRLIFQININIDCIKVFPCTVSLLSVQNKWILIEQKIHYILGTCEGVYICHLHLSIIYYNLLKDGICECKTALLNKIKQNK